MSKNHTLIVGGTRGMGRAAARLFAASGHTVSIISRQKPSAGSKIPRTHHWQADIANAGSLPGVIKSIVKKNGKLSAIAFFQRHRGKEDDWRGEIETSLTGTKNLIELAAPHFQARGGAIVLVSSVNAFLITRGIPLGYHLAKAGLCQLVRYYAVALGPKGIRVNSVSPGTLLKDESKDFFLKNKPLMALYKKMSPLGRLGTAEELARTVRYLCSDDASFLTGQDIVLDGGLSILWQEALARELIFSKK